MITHRPVLRNALLSFDLCLGIRLLLFIFNLGCHLLLLVSDTFTVSSPGDFGAVLDCRRVSLLSVENVGLTVGFIDIRSSRAHRAKSDGSLAQAFGEILCIWLIVRLHFVRFRIQAVDSLPSLDRSEVDNADLLPSVLGVAVRHVLKRYKPAVIRTRIGLKDRILDWGSVHLK